MTGGLGTGSIGGDLNSSERRAQTISSDAQLLNDTSQVNNRGRASGATGVSKNQQRSAAGNNRPTSQVS